MIKIYLKSALKKNEHLTDIQLDKNSKILTLNFKNVIHNPNIYFLKKKKNKYSRIVIDYQKKIEKKKVIVIDPGHGGKDSGAIGVRKQLEKNITLAVGKLLKRKIESNGKFDVILTRNRDIFLKLRERTKIAKKSNADIFISLHADYNKNKNRGISLYTLSENASDKEDALAEENKSDLFGNVDLSDETSEVITSLLILLKEKH